MVLTKKRLALLTFVLIVVYFVPLLYLPENIIGSRDENMLLFVPKLVFLAITAAIVTIFALILIFKNDYIKVQLHTFDRFKHYLKLLIKRDFVAKYRKSILGVLWSLLNPLLTMTVMTFVFSHVFARSVENFPVYLFSGLILYQFFNESTTLAMNSVIASEGIIKKIYVPKYVFPLSRVVSSLINLCFSLITFLIVFIVTGAQFKWTILLLPVPIIYTFVFALGVAMLLSSLAVFFRDLTYLYGVLTLMLMYTTPIFWTVTILPEWMVPVIGLNPLYHFVDYFRSLALEGVIPDLWSNMVCIGFALAALCGGTYVFMRQQDKYILNM
ncbi:MAG: ABC transporter permease [Oscillospiraceae bacterium]|jgi:ABC-type polysaccharide/polyol phosphate export permease|nr:ABC transporter permease [Oscillospiraceae bacterium]